VLIQCCQRRKESGCHLALSSVAQVAQAPKMVCSNCHNWIDGEWLLWRRYDAWEHRWVPSCMLSFHVWQGGFFFFYCHECRVTDPTLKGRHINADGNVLTDSDSERDDGDGHRNADGNVLTDSDSERDDGDGGLCPRCEFILHCRRNGIPSERDDDADGGFCARCALILALQGGVSRAKAMRNRRSTQRQIVETAVWMEAELFGTPSPERPEHSGERRSKKRVRGLTDQRAAQPRAKNRRSASGASRDTGGTAH
jgi:hypothetical protein